MTDEILHDIIAHTDKLSNWTQTISVIHDGVSIDISSAANGKLSTIPVGAPNSSQLGLPSGSRYRFDSLQYKGLVQLKSITRLILGPSFCPGCQMMSSHQSPASPHRQGTWEFACSKHRASRIDNTPFFSPGHMSMKNIKPQTLKRKKTSGSTHAGVEGMYSHKTRLEMVVQSEVEDTPKREPPLPLHKRMLTKRPENQKTACPMHIIVFMDYNGFYYLSTKSSLLHKFHTFVPPEVIPRRLVDLDDREAAFMNTLVNLHASHKLITRIFENLKGASFGTFLHKSIYYMNRKSEELLGLAQGITSDMSDAQKTLKKLDLYVPCYVRLLRLFEFTHQHQCCHELHYYIILHCLPPSLLTYVCNSSL